MTQEDKDEITRLKASIDKLESEAKYPGLSEEKLDEIYMDIADIGGIIYNLENKNVS